MESETTPTMATSESLDGTCCALSEAVVAEDLRQALSRVRESRQSRGTPYPRALRERTVAFALRRRAAGASYDEIARRLGMHTSTLYDWWTREASGPVRASRLRGWGSGSPGLAEPETSPAPVPFAPVRVVDEREAFAPGGSGFRASGEDTLLAVPTRRLVLHAPGGLRLTGLSAEEAALILARLLRPVP